MINKVLLNTIYNRPNVIIGHFRWHHQNTPLNKRMWVKKRTKQDLIFELIVDLMLF